MYIYIYIYIHIHIHIHIHIYIYIYIRIYIGAGDPDILPLPAPPDYGDATVDVVRPVHLLRVSLLRVLESNFPGDPLKNSTDMRIPTP